MTESKTKQLGQKVAAAMEEKPHLRPKIESMLKARDALLDEPHKSSHEFVEPFKKLRAPLVSDIEIKANAAPETYILSMGDDGQPSTTAKLETYDITFTLKYKPDSTAEREALAEILTKAVNAAEEREPLRRLIESGYDYGLKEEHRVELDWSKENPTAKVTGTFTKASLDGLYETGLLETNRNVAEAFATATKEQRRRQPESTNVESLCHGEYIPPSSFSPEHAEPGRVDAMGNMAMVDESERFSQLIKDIRNGLKRGDLELKDAVRIAGSVTDMGLDGTLQCPFPTAQFRLAELSKAAESGMIDTGELNELKDINSKYHSSLIQQFRIEGFKQVMQAIIGPDKYFVPEEKGVVDVALPGERQPVTFRQYQAELLEQAEAEALKRKKAGVPDYWLGSIEEYKINLADSKERVREKMIAQSGGSTKKSLAEIMSEAKINEEVRNRQQVEAAAEQEKGLVPYSQLVPYSDRNDLSYVGVTYKNVAEDRRGNPIEYRSINPALGETPEPIPEPLQRVLDAEERTKQSAYKRPDAKRLEGVVIEGRS